eukprot:TRINITY_DN36195_c0_g1_i1.p1 TRINITY_DN36195_c0_g1~~TRINITY_DN36195_c0_g1_i1.p1  ORF type:complete len:342 (+),score=110.45 TRINITY_DN36195_c0_g1_i1:57-1028(+)
MEADVLRWHLLPLLPPHAVFKLRLCSRSFAAAVDEAAADASGMWDPRRSRVQNGCCRGGGWDAVPAAARLFRQHRAVLRLHRKCVVVGTLHGSGDSLRFALQLWADEGGPRRCTLVFLGSVVNEGTCSLQVLHEVCALKCAHPDAVVWLRGAHDDDGVCSSSERRPGSLYGGLSSGSREACRSLFRSLPVAAVTCGTLCVHGGPLQADTLATLSCVDLPVSTPDSDAVERAVRGYPAPTDDDGMIRSPLAFGRAAVDRLTAPGSAVQRMVCAGPSVREDGYEWLYEGRVLALWSAPDFYRSRGLRNAAGFCVLNDGAATPVQR